jgi:hypothetical protein
MTTGKPSCWPRDRETAQNFVRIRTAEFGQPKTCRPLAQCDSTELDQQVCRAAARMCGAQAAAPDVSPRALSTHLLRSADSRSCRTSGRLAPRSKARSECRREPILRPSCPHVGLFCPGLSGHPIQRLSSLLSDYISFAAIRLGNRAPVRSRTGYAAAATICELMSFRSRSRSRCSALVWAESM